MKRAILPSDRAQAGFSLIELLIVVAIIGLIAAMAIPSYLNAVHQSERAALMAECRTLHTAMMSYQADHGFFPAEADFDLTTLAPLSNEGYFSMAASLTSKLEGEQLLLYLAPDIGTPDGEFIVVMRAVINPDLVAVVAHTGLVSSLGFLDGVYMITSDQFQSASEL